MLFAGKSVGAAEKTLPVSSAPRVGVSGAAVGGKCLVGGGSRISGPGPLPDQQPRAVSAEAAGSDVAVAEFFLQRLQPEESKEPRTRREAGAGALSSD